MSDTPKTPRRIVLKRARDRNLRRFAILRQAGLVEISMWVPQAWVEEANRRASTLNFHRQTVFRAAVEVGLRWLRPSDIQRTEQRWRGIIGLPVAPRYPGERFSHEKSFDLAAWNRDRRNGRHHLGATPGVLKSDGAPAGGGTLASPLLAPSGTPEMP